VALYGPIVYGGCLHAHLRPEDAADVGQDVVGAVARKVAHFRRDRPGDSFRGWLWTITSHKICDFRKKHGRRIQGATLYALLTGRAPLQAGSAEEMMEKARRGAFLPVRQLKRDIPRTLEAICLKAMAFAPEERYATALDLAAEVDRWLADEPVRAYREPWTTRTRRWLKRHRLPVTGAAAALLAVVIVSGGAWLRQVQAEVATASEVEKMCARVRALYKEDKLSAALVAARRAEALLEKGGRAGGVAAAGAAGPGGPGPG
jgi:hypothetical protein